MHEMLITFAGDDGRTIFLGPDDTGFGSDIGSVLGLGGLACTFIGTAVTRPNLLQKQNKIKAKIICLAIYRTYFILS